MQLLKPEYLKSVEGLALLARKMVDSYYAGLNQSRRNGTGQEFSQYRSYQPGDDIRLLDWKLYARSDRFYIRESEVETNIEVAFILDASASMQHEEAGLQKLDYARFLIATLAWLAQRQGDWVSLYALNDQQMIQVNPKPGRQFFQRFLYELLNVKGSGIFPETSVLQLPFSRKRAKKLIIFLTDMYEENGELSGMIRQLNLPHHEVLLFQIFGQKERYLEYEGVLTFEDLETGQRKQVNSRKLKKSYQENLDQQLERIKKQLLQQKVTHQVFTMPEHPGEALKAFLRRRQKLIG